jgi:MoaA/NifB/PqqE/SkfB family radical SAM enzyme
MALRPYELHLELTNICNANCLFCPYQFQTRPESFMSDAVFEKAVSDFCAIQGGSVGLTPIVGDALIDPKFLDRVKFLRTKAQVDRIFITTNGILLDKFGFKEILRSGITSITISTSGFEEESYKRIYRSSAYQRMRQNVTRLVEENERLGRPVHISIGIRSDRPLNKILRDPDVQPILKFKPTLDFTWSYTSAGGRVTRDILPEGMKLRASPSKMEPCVNLFNGPIVLPDGTVLACSCVAAMDAVEDLRIGNIMEHSLAELYAGQALRGLRNQFKSGGCLNKTCTGCDMYRGLELYRTREGRRRAELNRRRHLGELISRKDQPDEAFSGG